MDNGMQFVLRIENVFMNIACTCSSSKKSEHILLVYKKK